MKMAAPDAGFFFRGIFACGSDADLLCIAEQDFRTAVDWPDRTPDLDLFAHEGLEAPDPGATAIQADEGESASVGVRFRPADVENASAVIQVDFLIDMSLYAEPMMQMAGRCGRRITASCGVCRQSGGKDSAAQDRPKQWAPTAGPEANGIGGPSGGFSLHERLSGWRMSGGTVNRRAGLAKITVVLRGYREVTGSADQAR